MAESTLEILRRIDFHSALAVEAIALERLRQIEQENWTPQHDDEHSDGALAVAAGCYAQHAGGVGVLVKDKPPTWWPWDAQWWKPKSPRADLIRAGALTVAEMARRARASEERLLQKENADG